MKAETPEEKLRGQIKAQALRIRELTELLSEVSRGAKWKAPRVDRRRSKSGAYRTLVAIPDRHGNWADPIATAVFLDDLGSLGLGRNDLIVFGGDQIEAGGFLSEHHVIGYVAEKGQVSYRDDIASCNWFLDRVQERSGGAEIIYIEGNHELRIERWCATRFLSTPDDSKYLYDLISPEKLLNLGARGIRYIRTGEKYDGLHVPGIIKIGKCFFTHGFSHGENAARDHVRRAGGNICFFHVHRILQHMVSSLAGTFSGFSPGCLAIRQRYYEHSRPNDHAHGYGIQRIDARTDDFLHLNIPIIGGRSFLAPLSGALK